MKGTLFRERYIRATNNEKLSKSLPMIVSTLEFCKTFGKLSKGTKKCEIFYKNFALCEIETTVDVMCQKQLPKDVLKIFIEMLCKLNGFLLNWHFCSFKIFLWYLMRLTNLKRFFFGLSYSNSPLLKWKSIFLVNKIKNY